MIRSRFALRRGAFLALPMTMILALAACSGGGASPSAADQSSAPAASQDAETGSLSISAADMAFDTDALTAPAGSVVVTFTNNDSVSHEMASNPHPVHTDCPEINSVGFLSPGQSKMTANLNTARTCGYHDHNRSSDTSLQGTIVIQ